MRHEISHLRRVGKACCVIQRSTRCYQECSVWDGIESDVRFVWVGKCVSGAAAVSKPHLSLVVVTRRTALCTARTAKWRRLKLIFKQNTIFLLTKLNSGYVIYYVVTIIHHCGKEMPNRGSVQGRSLNPLYQTCPGTVISLYLRAIVLKIHLRALIFSVRRCNVITKLKSTYYSITKILLKYCIPICRFYSTILAECNRIEIF